MAIESVGYYALPVIPSLQGVDREVNSQMKRSFGGLGRDIGQHFGRDVAAGIKQSANAVASAAKTHTEALEKVADATGKVRAEEAKLATARSNAASRAQAVGTAERRLEQLRATGTATDKQLAAAERQVATARERARSAGSNSVAIETRVESLRRRETAATREAATAERNLADARRQSSRAGGDAMGGLRQALSGGGGGAGGGLAALAGGLGTKVGGAFMGALGAVVSVAAVGALFKSALDVGIDFERTVNAFSGVTNSNAEGMERMREAARALGTDTQLAGVSARDAGAAMLELAKGGLTAEQAMAAARGTLQLATAGQIDAAEAAKYQTAALNMFQLKAEDATHVADLLAAAANGSSADVTDLGQALQQGGSVAAGFGTSIEDTLTALTMFSRMGINGSDAGTMLKTSLQAITDRGNPAQGAIEQLGLALYDANGEFVGVESMMKQVAEASKRMTAEQFQAATATLFGSDAMRASMIAAAGGAEAWDSASAAVNQQGAAARMAGAQMQGLPGIVEALSNTWEGLKLKLFDVIDGPLITIGNWFTDLLSDGPEAGSMLGTVGDNFRSAFEGIGDVLGPIKSVFSSLGDAWQQYIAPALSEYMGKLKGPLGDLGKQLGATFREAMPVLKAVGLVLGGVLLGAIKAVSITVPIMIRAFTVGQAVTQKVFQGIKIGATVLVEVAKVIGGVFVGAWNLLKSAASGVWSVLSPVFDGIKAGLGFLADAGRYAFETVLVPMWHNFQTVAGAVGQALQPVFSTIDAGFTILKTAATVAWQEGIVPAWEAIKGAFSAGWAAISPVFEQIKGAFTGVRDFVGSVWNGLAGVVKSALDAVINAVKGPLRWIGGVLQKVPLKVGPLEIPGAQAAKDLGNTLAGLRAGGVAGVDRNGRLFGPGTGTSDSILGVDTKGRPTALVSAGEGIVNARAMKAGGDAVVAALNRKVPAYRDGGVVTESERARMGGGTVNLSILEMLRSLNPDAVLTSAKTDHSVDGGFHPKGQAIDVDPSEANIAALWRNREKLSQIIFDDPERVWYNVGGQRAEGAEARAIYGEATMAQHRNHIHVAAANEVTGFSQGDRPGRGIADLPGLDSLDASASPEQAAQAVVAEALRRGYSREEAVAAASTMLQESGGRANAVGGGGAWHGYFQQDSSYSERDDPAGNIRGFFDRLDEKRRSGGASGDIWKDIFWLQQAPGAASADAAYSSGRQAYLSEIQSQRGRAESAAAGLATVDPYGSSGTGTDSKAVREAEQRLADREQAIGNAERVLAERESKLANLPADATADQRATAERLRDEAEQKLDRAKRERDDAAADLDTARAKASETSTSGSSSSSDTGGESQLGELGSIGKTFLSEMFGFGDLLPNPADLGIVKLASALMGIKYTPQGHGFPWQTGYANGDGTPWSGTPASPLDNLTGEAGSVLDGIVPGVSSMLPPLGQPAAAAHEGSGAAPGPVDASTNVTINNPQGTPEQNESRLRRTLLKTPRYGTYTQQPGVMGK